MTLVRRILAIAFCFSGGGVACAKRGVSTARNAENWVDYMTKPTRMKSALSFSGFHRGFGRVGRMEEVRGRTGRARGSRVSSEAF